MQKYSASNEWRCGNRYAYWCWNVGASMTLPDQATSSSCATSSDSVVVGGSAMLRVVVSTSTVIAPRCSR